jgi:protein O-mannosyl-transferase
MSKKQQSNPKPSSNQIPDSLTNIVPDNNHFGNITLPEDEVVKTGIWHTLTKGFIPYALLFVFATLLNSNTFKHEYALDDDIIVCKNQFVIQGIKGIPDIFKYDVFESFYRSMNTTAQLAGGRYRPFSVATFALEQEFIGTITIPDSVKNKPKFEEERAATNAFLVNHFMRTGFDVNKNTKNDPAEDVNKDGLWNEYDIKIKGMGMRHINNVLLYALSMCFIFMFLSKFIFKQNKWFALIVSLLFLAHPLHTEVIANVKSRDEILSLMFMTLTMHFSFLWNENKKKINLVWAALFYFIALMSKEYGASLLIIIPASLYVYNKKDKLIDYLPLMVSIGSAFLIYYLIRYSVVGGNGDAENLQDGELLNNPYLKAEGTEKRGTQMFINLKYALALIFPIKLSCDYSYTVIPYKSMFNPLAILALIMMLGSLYASVKLFIKRSWLFFPVSFALIHLLLVDNFFFNIGATMGERLVYHTSLGTCILIAYGIWWALKKLNVKNMIVPFSAITLLLVGAYAARTWVRNPAWKNDITLHLTDVKTYPESTMLNGNACTRLIELSEKPTIANTPEKIKRFLDSAKIYGKKSLVLHDGFVNSFLNMGIIYAKQKNMDSASYYWANVERLYPNHPQLPAIKQTLISEDYNLAIQKANNKDYAGAAILIEKLLKKTPNNANLYYDLGVMYLNNNEPQKCKDIWAQGSRVAPTDPKFSKGIADLINSGKAK